MQELNHTSPVDFEALFNDKVLAPNAVYKLMGNGMHRMQVGQLLLYIMANVAFRDSVFGLDLDAVLHYLNLIVCCCASDVCCLSQIIFVVVFFGDGSASRDRLQRLPARYFFSEHGKR